MTNFATDIAKFSPRQLEALAAISDPAVKYLLYGGALGGGKSYFLRWLCLYWLMRMRMVYGLEACSVMLACEDYPALKDRQLQRIGFEFPSYLGKLHADHPTYGRAFVMSPDYGGGVVCFRNLDDPSKYQCFHESTRILTRYGWKPIADVRVGDAVLSLNPINRCTEWRETTAVHKYNDIDTLYAALDPSGPRFAVTDNHKLWIVTPEYPYAFQCRADELPEVAALPLSAEDWGETGRGVLPIGSHPTGGCPWGLPIYADTHKAKFGSHLMYTNNIPPPTFSQFPCVPLPPLTRIPNSGPVYCVTVPPHHSLLIEFDNSISWSGNSAEFSMICVDELTKNDYDVFTFLRSRLRWSGLPDHECKFVGATNPGGVGMSWVKALWIDGIFSDEWRRPVDMTKGFKYIPAKATDNPHLDEAYWTSLQTLPEGLRAAFRDGDWNVFIGQAFPEFRASTHVIEPQPVPKNAPVYMTFDWGFGAPFSVGWWWCDADGRLYRFMEWYGWTGTPNMGLRMPDTDIAKGILQRESLFNQDLPPSQRIDFEACTRLISHDCFSKRPDYKGGGQGPSTAEVFADNGLYCSVGDPTRSLRIRQFRERLRLQPDGLPTMLIYSNCRQFIRTIPTLVMDKNNIEDVDTSTEDHCFTGDTLVDTMNGQIQIKDLVDTSGYVLTAGGYWTGYRNCRMVCSDSDLVKVTFEDGTSIRCTPDHEFFIYGKGFIEAKDLAADAMCCMAIPNHKHLNREGPCKSMLSAKSGKSLMGKDSPGCALSVEKNSSQMGCKINGLVHHLVAQDSHGKLARVRSVEALKEREPVYCLVAETTHAFSVCGGFLVHNCYDEACHVLMARPIGLQNPRPRKSPVDRRIEKLESPVSSGSEWEDYIAREYLSMGGHENEDLIPTIVGRR